ncbi:MAG: sigma-54-dependent transcriptional regulator, partial [Desulforhopalus sp.]
MNNRVHVLIVDDDVSILEVLEARLTASGYHVYSTSSGPAALEILKKNRVDILISDMKMPEMSGMDLLEKATELTPQLPVIFLTAYGTIPDAVHAVKAGAVDYLTKPFDGKELVRRIEKILAVEAKPPDHSAAQDNDFIWGSSESMSQLKNLLLKVAASDANVLVLGESGVGKECIARLLHESSPRRKQAYIVVDCGSTPPGILESELFGHVKGSFTHAIQDKKGLIEAADGGTLFLDEVGNISQEMQSRLLRFLEDRKIRQ